MSSKCYKSEKKLTICQSLSSRIQDNFTRQKGFYSLKLSNMDTHERTRDFVLYLNSIKDKGTVLNYCPFCGTNINSEME